MGYKKNFLSFLSPLDSSSINSRPLVRQLFVAVSAPSSQYVGLFRALSLSSCIAGGERSGQVQAADCCGALSGVEALPLTLTRSGLELLERACIVRSQASISKRYALHSKLWLSQDLVRNMHAACSARLSTLRALG